MRTKFILSLMFTLLVSVIGGNIIASVTGFNPLACSGGLFGLSLIPGLMPTGASAMGLLRELWTGEIIKKFRHDGSWMSRIPNRSDLVINNTIHLVDIGSDPEVLINNTTYPIPVNLRTDSDVPIGLDKFDTENTAVSDDELQGLPYDKPGSVVNQHTATLEEKTAEKAAHSLAPTTTATGTPIIVTTGSSNGETIARKRLLPADLINAKKKLDKLKVPKMDRILVLCPEHVEDLLMVDEKFALQYKNMKSGEVLPMYGFDIYEFGGNPKYTESGGVYTKKAFGSADDDSNDYVSSLFFYTGRTMQFRGNVTMYQSLASQDPEYRRSVVGFRLYHMAIPVKADGYGALVSGKV